MTLEEMRQDSDWRTIFGEGGYVQAFEKISNPITREVIEVAYTFDDVASIIASSDGENDTREWIGLFLMKDGRYVFIEAQCDYTGWNCEGGGSSEWFRSIDEVVACIKQEYRDRLGGNNFALAMAALDAEARGRSTRNAT